MNIDRKTEKDFEAKASRNEMFPEKETGSSNQQRVPLAGIVNRTGQFEPLAEGRFRRYASSFNTTTFMNNGYDSSDKGIVYEVGSRFKTAKINDCFNILRDPNLRSPQIMDCSGLLSVEITSRFKKYTNFTAPWDRCDLSAIAFTLAVALAKFSLTGTLTVNEMLDGQMIRINSITTAIQPITASENGVFIPRLVDNVGFKSTFCALVVAANANEATVYTDNLETDGNNAVLLTTYSDQVLALGCYKGLNALLSMYENMSAGNVIGYAITKGIHHVLTLVGHTDEGGLLRDIFRRRSFAVPFGGIYNWNETIHPGLPMPRIGNLNSFVCLVDSILLGSSALVALCDPLVKYEDKFFPTIFTSCQSLMSDDPAPELNDVTLDELKTNMGNLGSHFTQFSLIYGQCIGDLFHSKSDDKNVALFMERQCDDLVSAILSCDTLAKAEALCRHAKPKILAPYYFIEPTSIFRTGFCSNNLAVIHGFGYLVGINDKIRRQAFEKFTVKEYNTGTYIVSAQLRSVRTSALLLHLQSHKKDGLAFIKPIQFAAGKLVSTGVIDEPITRVRGRRDIAGYMWGRGQSCIMAPSECMYTGSTITSLITHSTFDNDNHVYKRNHIPSITDIGNMEIELSCSNPQAISSGKLDAWIKNRNNARNMSTKALENARVFLGSSQPTGGEILFIGERDVDLGTPVATAYPSNDPKQDDYGGKLHIEQFYGTGTGVDKGPPRKVTFMEQPHRMQIQKTNKPAAGSGHLNKGGTATAPGERDGDGKLEKPLDMAGEEKHSLTLEERAPPAPPVAE